MHWTITNQEPVSPKFGSSGGDQKSVLREPDGSADAMSFLRCYSFLVTRSGVREWGYSGRITSHGCSLGVASSKGADIRVVVPTSQIFLEVTIPSTQQVRSVAQKSIHEYTRRDVQTLSSSPATFRFFLSADRQVRRALQTQPYNN